MTSLSDDEHRQLSVVSIAQTLLAAEKGGAEITPSLILEKVRIAAGLFSATDLINIDAAVNELVRRFSLWIGKDSTLVSNEGHEPWLVASRRRDWHYWQRYRQWLERRQSPAVVEALDESTSKILGLLEDPLRAGAWDRRGLVVGHVQSGKTGNYTGLICKAADAGYKIIIVLAGLHNNLRSQTQIRLEEGFLGYETSSVAGGFRPIGVGTEDSDSSITPNCATNRSDSGDFNTKVAQHFAISPEQRPWLFVVKKNKTVLQRLLEWIEKQVADTTSPTTGRRFVSNLPLLLVDDEADHASVDTGEQLFDLNDGTPDDEHEPKAINSRIRRILHVFSKSAYVGYTATPFANIFIHRRNATPEEGPDLFPRSFILSLAAPSDYIGPARIFGLHAADGRSDGLPLIRYVADHVDSTGLGGWMPPRHRKEHAPLYNGESEVPPSLRAALGAFILACAARVVRGQGSQHSSMLVHVTRLNLVQNEVHRQVEDVVRRMRQKLTRAVDHQALQDELRKLWECDFIPTGASVAARLSEQVQTPEMPTWQEIRSVLPETLADIEVRTINGTAKDVVDYSGAGKGLKVIAIGGDKLARGLTLEGLCVSYFVRTSKMYDTLMQMGRWFGYRPMYADLCRLYTTSELVEWFGHIADASEELRQEFDAMAANGATPREYGLRVQSHPVLLVTSPLKMRSARDLQLSFSGELLETVAFHRNTEILRGNLQAVDRLIIAMGPPSERDPRRRRGGADQEWKGGYVWNSVPSALITDFFASYVTHPAARKVNSALLLEFLRAMTAQGELTSWTVALLGGGAGRPHRFPAGIVVQNMITRKPDEGGPEDRYSIGRLLSPRDEAIDLGEVAWQAALDYTLRAWTPDPARQKDGAAPSPPEVPNGPSIRRVRGEGAAGVPKAPERGLLLLYPLDPKTAGFGSEGPPIIGFGASFPASRSGTLVTYRVDHLLWEREYGSAD